MRDLRSLEQTLAANLPWHKAHIKFVAAFVLALVTVNTVNLVEIACALNNVHSDRYTVTRTL